MSEWKSYPVDHIDKLETLIQNITSELSEYDMTLFFNPAWTKNSFKSYKIDLQKDCVSFIYTHDIIEEPTHRPGYNDFDLARKRYVKRSPNGYDYYIEVDSDSSIMDSYSQYYQESVQSKVYNYSISYSFDKNGKLLSFNISHGSRVLYSLFVGNNKILINSKEWYNREDFEEKAFQQSLVSKRESFDIYFSSILLKSFNTI